MEVKEESKDVRIEETFRVKQEDTEEQTVIEIASGIEAPTAEINRPRIYIIGDSCVHHGEKRARETIGTSLGLCAHVRWFGRGGLVWRNLLSWFEQCLGGGAVPDVLLIHCGGNDLGNIKSLKLVEEMKQDLQALRRKFPQMKIIFSDITQRLKWRCPQPQKMEKARRFINSVMASFVLSIGGAVVHHPHIKYQDHGIFLIDGVRLSLLGNDMFLKNIAQCLKEELQ